MLAFCAARGEFANALLTNLSLGLYSELCRTSGVEIPTTVHNGARRHGVRGFASRVPVRPTVLEDLAACPRLPADDRA
jgi:hypothetical protein